MKTDKSYLDRLAKSRTESEIQDESDGLECGMTWAKDDAEWRDLLAIEKLNPDETDIYELVNVLVSSREWASYSEMLEIMFGEDMKPSNGHARGFIAGAMKIKEELDAL